MLFYFFLGCEAEIPTVPEEPDSCAITTDSVACSDGQVACGASCIDPIAPTLDELQARVFVGCAFQGCHGADAPAADLVLSDADTSFDNLIDRSAVQNPDWALVRPGDADESYLLAKLDCEGMTEGLQMPLGAPPVCDAKFDALVAWIEAGALR